MDCSDFWVAWSRIYWFLTRTVYSTVHMFGACSVPATGIDPEDSSGTAVLSQYNSLNTGREHMFERNICYVSPYIIIVSHLLLSACYYCKRWLIKAKTNWEYFWCQHSYAIHISVTKWFKMVNGRKINNWVNLSLFTCMCFSHGDWVLGGWAYLRALLQGSLRKCLISVWQWLSDRKERMVLSSTAWCPSQISRDVGGLVTVHMG